MVSLGPELPSTETAKRKRADGNEESERVPSPPSQPHSPTATDKRRRVIGPSLPPGPLDERPSGADESDDESSSDDGVGPALPRSMGGTIDEDPNARRSPVAEESQPAEGKEVLQREEWMLVPPKQEAWSSRVDPTKLRNRKFNTGMGAKAPAQVSDGDNALWTETPEQKRQRLADEVMGVRKPATEGGTTPRSKANASEDQATAQRIREYNERHRHQSLYDAQKKSTSREAEDDPSQRAFDKEKDIRGGRKVGHAQRKELVNRAADFGSRFSGGGFL